MWRAVCATTCGRYGRQQVLPGGLRGQEGPDLPPLLKPSPLLSRPLTGTGRHGPSLPTRSPYCPARTVY